MKSLKELILPCAEMIWNENKEAVKLIYCMDNDNCGR